MPEEKKESSFLGACSSTGILCSLLGAWYGGVPWAIGAGILGLFLGGFLYVALKVASFAFKAVVCLGLLLAAILFISSLR